MNTLKDLTILVIEDERPLMKAIQIKLESVGLSVATAVTVAQGLNYLEELPKIDAIWLDHYLLGKESGLDFVAKVKSEDSKWKKIPIFVVSNTASPDKVQTYMRLGAEKYYTKSEHRLDQIVQDIREYIEKSSPKE